MLQIPCGLTMGPFQKPRSLIGAKLPCTKMSFTGVINSWCQTGEVTSLTQPGRSMTSGKKICSRHPSRRLVGSTCNSLTTSGCKQATSLTGDLAIMRRAIKEWDRPNHHRAEWRVGKSPVRSTLLTLPTPVSQDIIALHVVLP